MTTTEPATVRVEGPDYIAGLTTAQRKVLRSLERHRDRIATYEAKLKDEYAARLEDFRAARLVMPPCLVRDICSSAGITEEAYRAVLRKANEPNGPGQNTRQKPSARNAEMRAARDAGATLEDLSRRFNLSRERVRQITSMG